MHLFSIKIESFSTRIFTLLKALYAGIGCGILVLVLFAPKSWYTPSAINSSLFSSLFLFIVVLLCSGTYWLFSFFRAEIVSKIPHFRLLVLGCSLLLLGAQILITHQIYFYTGWDPGILYETSQQILNHGYTDFLANYFSTYPNNLFLLAIYTGTMFLGKLLFGGDGYALCLLLNHLLITGSGFLLTLLAARVLHSERRALFVWLLYAAFVGLSPWFTIPYSDTFALFFTILPLYLYSFRDSSQCRILRCFVFGFSVIIGAAIKPTVLIVLIAIILVELVRNIGFFRANWRNWLAKLATLVLAAICAQSLIVASVEPLGLKLDKNQAFSWPHFMMMGLNDVSHGVYLYSDVTYSASFATPEARVDSNFEVIQQRLNNFGAAGLLQFGGKKLLINYNVGTLGWWGEGEFDLHPVAEQNATISPFLRSIYYPSGSYYQIFATFMQFLWIFILFNMLFAFLLRRNEQSATMYVCLSSIIGITLFTLLFEARSRYLICFQPVYLLCAAVGFFSVADDLRRRNPNHDSSLSARSD